MCLFLIVFGLQICRLARRQYIGLIFISTLAVFFANRHKIYREPRYYYMFNEGCKLPFMEVTDKEIDKLDYDPHFVVNICTNFSLLSNNNSHIWIDEDMVEKNNIIKGSTFCCYQAFERPIGIDVNIAEQNIKVQYKPCKNFTNYVEVSSEFAKVSCSYKFKNHTREKYVQFFLFAPFKKMTDENNEDQKQLREKSGYNVLILGFSGMSRMNFYRTMPHTFSFLYSSDTVELQAYHKLEGNELIRMMPMFLGLTEKEMRRTCWPHTSAHFDNCPFIWTLYKNASYYTALGEDCSNLNLFNFRRYGFLKAPADYYTYPFIKEASVKDPGSIEVCKSCMGNKYFHKVILDYIANLANTLRHSKLFGFFWETCISHEFHLAPLLMDDDYHQFFMNLRNSGYLNDTIIFLTSNSGMRWGKIRLSQRGRMEERLPIMQILVPPSFRDKYRLAYENLRINMYRLTTPFDVYATLKDLVNLSTIEDKNLKYRSNTAYSRERGISLFLPVPTNRTCADIGLGNHECVCDRMGQNIETNSTIAFDAAAYTVEHVNYKMLKYQDCAQLKVLDIIKITKFGNNYDVVLVLEPEVIQLDGLNNYIEIEATLISETGDKWKIVGDVHRTNGLSKESNCNRFVYHELCYCYDNNWHFGMTGKK